VRDHHLRVLLENRRDRQRRDVLLDRVKLCSEFRAHEEVDLLGEQRQAVVHLRAARHDRDLETVFRIGAVGDRLIEAAMLGLSTQLVPNETLSSVCACAAGRAASAMASAQRAIVANVMRVSIPG